MCVRVLVREWVEGGFAVMTSLKLKSLTQSTESRSAPFGTVLSNPWETTRVIMRPDSRDAPPHPLPLPLPWPGTWPAYSCQLPAESTWAREEKTWPALAPTCHTILLALTEFPPAQKLLSSALPFMSRAAQRSPSEQQVLHFYNKHVEVRLKTVPWLR